MNRIFNQNFERAKIFHKFIRDTGLRRRYSLLQIERVYCRMLNVSCRESLIETLFVFQRDVHSLPSVLFDKSFHRRSQINRQTRKNEMGPNVKNMNAKN